MKRSEIQRVLYHLASAFENETQKEYSERTNAEKLAELNYKVKTEICHDCRLSGYLNTLWYGSVMSYNGTTALALRLLADQLTTADLIPQYKDECSGSYPEKVEV